MTLREKEMDAIKKQIAKLEERLEYLSNLPDTTIEDETLFSFDDFPRDKRVVDAIYFQMEKRLIAEGAEYEEYTTAFGTFKSLKKYVPVDEITVKDLISCKEKFFYSRRGIGKKRMDALKNWMEKHELYFLG